MRRQRQLPPDEPEFLPSTTRAVAWGALFFAFLAFLISSATLLLTYQDGRLARGAGLLLQDARSAIEKAKKSNPGAANASMDAADPSAVQRDKVHQQLDRYVEMIKSGDTQARYYLEGLRGDLDRLRQYSSDHGSEWIAEASKTIDSARGELAQNAPEAVRKLSDLSSQLVAKASELRGGGSQDSGKKKDEGKQAETAEGR